MKKLVSYCLCLVLMIVSVGCETNLSGVFADNTSGLLKENVHLTIREKNINKIELNNGVGDVHLVTNQESEGIVIDVVKKIQGKNKQQRNNVNRQIKVNVKENKGNLVIVAKYMDEDLWKWKRNHYHDDISLDYTVRLPGTISDYIVNTGVGDIEFNNLSPLGNSRFDTGVGDIKIGLSKIEPSESLSFNTDLGDIHLNIPHNLKCRVEENSEEEIHIKGEDGGFLKASTGLGEISLKRY